MVVGSAARAGAPCDWLPAGRRLLRPPGSPAVWLGSCAAGSRSCSVRACACRNTGSSAPRRHSWWSTRRVCVLRSGAADSAQPLLLSALPVSAASIWQLRTPLRWSTPACAPRIYAGPSRLASACVMDSSRASFTVIGDVPRPQRRSLMPQSLPRLLFPPRSGLVQLLVDDRKSSANTPCEVPIRDFRMLSA